MATVEIDIVGKDNFSSTLGNFGNIITGIKSAVDLVSGAFNAAAGFVAPFIDAAVESQDAIANLDATLRSMGDMTGLSSQQLQDMASALQEVTRFSDETIINGEAMLLTFGNIGGEVFPEAVESMLDLAAKFGSVEQASVMLGKALNDPIAGVTALRRVGVQLSEEQEESIRLFVEQGDIASAQGIILGELERQVGGLAEAYGDTFAGKLEIFKNRLGEVQETIGNALLPVLSSLMDWAMQFMPTVERLGELFGGLFEAIADEGLFSVEVQDQLAAIDEFIGDFLQGFADSIDDWLASGGAETLSDKIISWIDGIDSGSGFDSRILAAAGAILEALGEAFMSIDWDGITEALDAALGRAVQEHDWTASGASFGSLLDSILSGNIDLRDADSEMIPAIGDALNRWLLGAVGAVSWEQWREAAAQNIENMLQAALQDAANHIRSRVGEIQGAWRQIGEDIVEGLSMGMSFETMRHNITTFVSNVITYFKTLLGISSPSSVFADIGRNIVLGLIGGFASMVGLLTAAINTIVSLILAPFAPILELLGLDGGSIGTSSTVDPNSELGGGGGGGGGGAPVTNNYYGPVYFMGAGEPGAYYDCPSPNPLLSATAAGV